MNQPLFLVPQSYDSEKSAAAETPLPESPNEWPQAILQELYKQVPFVSDFEPAVEMERVDGERGYAFGHVTLQNKTEMSPNAGADVAETAGVHSVRVPIIVTDRKLQPFDVMVTEGSKVLPLTEHRLRAAIFRPQPFDLTSKTPGDTSMMSQLYPPFRQGLGGLGGGGLMMGGGMGKVGSSLEAYLLHDPKQEEFEQKLASMQGALETMKEGLNTKLASVPNSTTKPAAQNAKVPVVNFQKTGSLLEAILPTISATDLAAFVENYEDPGVKAAMVKNRLAVTPALQKLASCNPRTVEKAASVVPNFIRPSVVQVVSDDGRYSVKVASHAYWAPRTEIVDRGEVLRRFGEKVVLAADLSGAITLADGNDAKEVEQPASEKPELIKDFGLYKVHDSQGKELIGYVFPNLLDTDGTLLPLALFTNGSQAAVQGEIAGVLSGGGNALPEGPPRGYGSFVRILSGGKVEATIPMEIQATLGGEEGASLAGETFDSRPVQVSIQPNIQAISEIDGQMLVPDTFRWMPLGDAGSVSLESNVDGGGEKEAAVRQALTHVTLRCGSADTYSIDGPSVEKLAAEERHFLTCDQTMFLLAGLGTDLDYATAKMAEALSRNAPVRVKVGRALSLARTELEEAEKRAGDNLARLPNFKRDLTKEAAFIPDPTAVDTVLSLGFVNPENMMTFVSYLPVIDETQSKLCELLVASRLGLKDVPANALEHAIRTVEDVVEGLKILAFSQKN
jgi:hypothetical protein